MMSLTQSFRSLLAAVVLLSFGLSVFAQNKVQLEIDAIKDSLAVKTGVERARLLGEIGYKYRFINNDSAWYYAQLANTLAIELQDENLQSRTLMNIGILQLEGGTLDDAIYSLKRALKLVDPIKSPEVKTYIFHNLGAVYEKKGIIDSAIHYSLNAINLYRVAKDSQNIAAMHLNMSNQYREIKEYDLSVEENLKAMEIYKALGDVFFQAAIENNLALLNNEFEKYAVALVHAQKSLELFNKIGQRLMTGYSYTNIGLAQKGLGNINEADFALNKALELQQERGDKYEVIRIKMHLAEVLNKRGAYNKAVTLANEAFAGAVDNNVLPFQQKTALTLSKIYENQGNYQNALVYLQKSTAAQDSLFFTDKAKEVLKLKEQYETEQKENEILRQQNELIESDLALKNRNVMLLAGGGLISLMLLIGFAVFRDQRLKAAAKEREAQLEKAMLEVQAQESLKEQRIRIARDLHDNIGSQLTYITSIIESTKKGIDQGEAFITGKLVQMGQFAVVTISELRDTIWAMNKDEISLIDIQERSKELAAMVHEATDDRISVRIDSEPSEVIFDSFSGMNLFRIIQECVNNAVKHSETNEIDVHFNELKDRVQVHVSDTGKGFNVQERSLGNGLRIMKTRAEKSGINFTLESIVGEGTTIKLELAKP